METLAANLRFFRGNRNQDEVAKATGIARVTYTRYENGQNVPDAETLCKLADYFKVTPNELLGYETKEKGNDMEDKKEIIEKFTKVVKLIRAGSGVKNLIYRKGIGDSEYVDIEFLAETITVNVSGDSGAAMLMEILRKLLY